MQDILRFAATPDDAERFLRIYYKFGALISKEAAQAAHANGRTNTPILDCLLAQAGLSDEGLERVRRLKAGFEALETLPGEALMRTIWGPLGYGGFVTERRLDPGKYFILQMLAAREPSAGGVSGPAGHAAANHPRTYGRAGRTLDAFNDPFKQGAGI